MLVAAVGDAGFVQDLWIKGYHWEWPIYPVCAWDGKSQSSEALVNAWRNLPRRRCLPVCSWLIHEWFPGKVNAQLIAPSLDMQFNCYLASIRLLLALCRILADVEMQTMDWWSANKINTVFYVLLIQGQVDLDEVFI